MTDLSYHLHRMAEPGESLEVFVRRHRSVLWHRRGPKEQFTHVDTSHVEVRSWAGGVCGATGTDSADYESLRLAVALARATRGTPHPFWKRPGDRQWVSHDAPTDPLPASLAICRSVAADLSPEFDTVVSHASRHTTLSDSTGFSTSYAQSEAQLTLRSWPFVVAIGACDPLRLNSAAAAELLAHPLAPLRAFEASQDQDNGLVVAFSPSAYAQLIARVAVCFGGGLPMGEFVSERGLVMVDDPTRHGQPMWAPFDDEGRPTARNVLVRNGRTASCFANEAAGLRRDEFRAESPQPSNLEVSLARPIVPNGSEMLLITHLLGRQKRHAALDDHLDLQISGYALTRGWRGPVTGTLGASARESLAAIQLLVGDPTALRVGSGVVLAQYAICQPPPALAFKPATRTTPDVEPK